MDKTKKKILIWTLIFDVIILIPIVFYFIIIPRAEIEKLSNGYVKVTQNKEGVSYAIVSKKPKDWKTLKEINYTAAHAIVVSEDWGFYQHNGYDLGQIKEAFVDSIEDGKKLRGASTISQQVVKNLFLSNERSFIRKLKELTFALYLERSVSKEKILEVYLNIIEYGKGLYGIGNASQHYFNKDVKDISAREGAFLAMLLPSPVRYSQSFKDKKLTPFAKEVIDSVLNKLVKAKYMKEEQLETEKKRVFRWEEGQILDESSESEATDENQPAGKKPLEFEQFSIEDKAKAARAKKRKRKKGMSEEETYRRDESVEVSDEPSFDDDAIMDDSSGVGEEFSLE